MGLTTALKELPALAAPERADTLVEHIFGELRRALLTGAFSPGQRMTIRALAGVLKVSPTPVREALGRLVAEGILEFGPNRTVQVPVLSPDRLAEIYRLRIVLEGIATGEAAGKLAKSDIATLEELQAKLVAAMNQHDYKAVLRINERFHFMIYEAAGLPLTLKIIDGLWLQMGPILNLLYPEFDRTRQGVHNHYAVIAGLKAGESAQAAAAMQKDLKDGERKLLKAVAKNSVPRQ